MTRTVRGHEPCAIIVGAGLLAKAVRQSLLL